ncbi:hypothetical protein LCGC14_0706990 [marine sediment metagenome]|uniref:Uncharacterized protein n=1 Tax=marine sediment metagenome TaxID=412755 RepID=A0A0F9T230_9ZZZZ|nr:MAG: hypothetical protein Lokiarch_11050 [Candidatus Lokiarchaeum sp. GC14_75]
MPLQPNHIIKFLNNETETKFRSELIDLLNKRIRFLCFEECERDRIVCTLTPLCSKRFLLKLRIKNHLKIEDLPQFCYSVHKGVIQRDFRNKRVVYKPNDAFVFIIDFLDIFFHGDYRKLNKFISFRNWEESMKIFDDRIQNRNENFKYLLTSNFFIFKFEQNIHIIFLNEEFVLCNANRERLTDLELLFGICKIFADQLFPEINLKLNPTDYVEISVKVPYNVLSKVKDNNSEEFKSKADNYFWNIFWEDLNTLTHYCEELNLQMDKNQNLEITLSISLLTNNYSDDGKRIPLRFRDLRIILNFINRIYTDYFVVWV